MLLWFAGVSLVLVWAVFRDPAIDYRVVALGAVLPDAVDVVVGHASVPHTLVFSVALLAAVMFGTRRRRHARRRLLGVPIGTFAHLLLDGVWTRTALFWWPAFGFSFDAGRIPSLTRPLAVSLALEVLGAVAIGWWVRRFRLLDAQRRGVFLRTGRLGQEFRPGRAAGT